MEPSIYYPQKFEGLATYQYVNLANDTLSIRFQDFQTEQPEKQKEYILKNLAYSKKNN